MEPARPDGDIWVFGYGSLMWRPGFDYVDVRPARLHGYHRSLCIYSITYRGTRDCPGLVFGLDHGGSCLGRAFLVAERDVDTVMTYLDEREMVNGVYRPIWHRVRFADGAEPADTVAYVFVADPGHEQYSGRLSQDEITDFVLQGRGKSGTCLDYLRNTFDHLEELGIHDHVLARNIHAAEARLKGGTS